jgi:hypothetical protein
MRSGTAAHIAWAAARTSWLCCSGVRVTRISGGLLAQRTVAAVSASSPDQVPVIHRLPVNHALWL